MKKLKSLLLCSTLAAFAGFTTSCEKEQGCMDESALNYDPDAEEDDGSCVYDDDTDGNLIVNQNISGNENWTNDNVYQLGGRITVLDGATLTIEEGTIIKGEAGTGANATALPVARVEN
ncbi:MAG: hypothetical protein U5L96_19335 [Owenweeksia sp.]|nr:hypothetical protein [Owenweeksia sp.]